MIKKLLFKELDGKLRKRDKDFLKILYRHRCLDILSGAYRYYYSKIYPYMPLCIDGIRDLIDNGLINYQEYPEEQREVISLTQFGVDYLESYVAMEKDPIFGSIKSARQLQINGRMIWHQLAVNATVLELLETADRKGTKYQYYDKLFTPAGFEKMPSDGMIILDGKIILVEIDTGSMRGKSLDHHWSAYRKFLDNLPPLYENYAVTILIVYSRDDDDDYDSGNSGSDTRRFSIAKSVCRSGLVLDLDSKADLYVVDRDQACDLLKNDFALEKTNCKMMKETVPLLSKNSQFEFYDTAFLRQMGSFYFFCYMCRNDSNSAPAVEDGRAVEFLIDFWLDRRFSVLQKILNIEETENAIKNSFIQREIPYVVVVPDMRTVIRIMAVLSDSALKKVYFTTPARIKKYRSFHKCLFRIDEELIVWGFRDNSLRHAVFERRLSPNTRRKS